MGVRYRDEILAPIVRQFFDVIRDDFILMNDNARPRRSRPDNQFLNMKQSNEWIGLQGVLTLMKSNMLGTFFREEFFIVKTHQTRCKNIKTHFFRNGIYSTANWQLSKSSELEMALLGISEHRRSFWRHSLSFYHCKKAFI